MTRMVTYPWVHPWRPILSSSNPYQSSKSLCKTEIFIFGYWSVREAILKFENLPFTKAGRLFLQALCGGPVSRVWEMAPCLFLPFSEVFSPSASWKWEGSLTRGCGQWLCGLLFKGTDTESVLLCLPAVSEVETTGKGGCQHGRHSRCWPTLAFHVLFASSEVYDSSFLVILSHTAMAMCSWYNWPYPTGSNPYRQVSMSVSLLPKDISSYRCPLWRRHFSLLLVRFWTSCHGQLFQ